MLTSLRAMTWPARLSVLGFGLGAGVAVGAILLEEVSVVHYWQTDGRREGFHVEAFGHTIQLSEDRGGTGITATELLWHGLALVAPLAGGVAATVGTVSVLAAVGRPRTAQAEDYDDRPAAAEPGAAADPRRQDGSAG
jgi:hypothetical protein